MADATTRASRRRRVLIAGVGLAASIACAGSALAFGDHVARQQAAEAPQAQTTQMPDPTPVPVSLPGGVRIYQDVTYASPDGYRPLTLDLYLPPPGAAAAKAGAGPSPDPNVPVVVYLHGGDWMAGSRKSPPGYATVFGAGQQSAVEVARMGYAVAAVDYRLAGEARWPAPLQDAKAAVRWLRANADAYHLDAAHIGAWGVSAGGQLASLLGVTGGVAGLEGDEGNPRMSSSVQAVASWAGASDLLTMDAQALPGAPRAGDANSPFSLLLGCRISRCQDLARQASPQTYVKAGDPPFLLAHGTADRQVPYAQSVAFAQALQQAKVPVKLDYAENADANFSGASPRQKDDMYNDLRTFLDASLKGQATR